MKKVSFLFAMIFAVSMAIGQDNTSSISQTGSDHEADITQAGDLNSASVIQNGGNENRLGAPVDGDVGVNVGSEIDDLSKAKGLVQEGYRNSATIIQTQNN